MMATTILRGSQDRISNKEETQMDNVTLIRVVAGALAVVVLFIIIWRRKRKIVE
jgi:hypothetical protein